MSLFAQSFREATKKFKDPSMASEVTNPISYPTSFLPFDFINGMLVRTDVERLDTVYSYHALGIGEGSIVMIVGKSGCGKTTEAIQFATSIVAPFRNSVVIHEDLEGATTLTRLQMLTGWNSSLIHNKYILRQAGINSESFLQRVKLHCDQKLECISKSIPGVVYNTGVKDYNGDDIYKPIPTVVLLDSLPLLNKNDTVLSSDLTGNMSAAGRARTNADLFTKIAPMLKASNTILIIVNHIQDNLQINPFAPKTCQLNYMKQEEKIPGGTMALYLTNTLIKTQTGASDKLLKEKDFGIDGFITKNMLLKSRSNRAGQEVKMVYDQSYGFDRVLSNFMLLKDNGLMRNSGAYFYIEGLETRKFYQKNFKQQFYDEIIMRQAMKEAVMSISNEIIPSTASKSMSFDQFDEFAKTMLLSE